MLLQHLGCVAQHARRINGETPVLASIAQAQGRDPTQARTVQQIGRTARAATEVKPVQRRAATGFQVGLIPHHNRFLDAALESKLATGRAALRTGGNDVRVPIKGYFDTFDEAMTHRVHPAVTIERYGELVRQTGRDGER